MKQIGTKNKYARKTRTGQHIERVFPLKTEIFCIKDKKEHGFPFNRFLIGGGKKPCSVYCVFFTIPVALRRQNVRRSFFEKIRRSVFAVEVLVGEVCAGEVSAVEVSAGEASAGRKLSGEKLPGKRDLTVRFSVRKTESAISAFFTREGKRRRYQAGKYSWGGFAGRKPDTWG